jgi:hypothetical protein
VRFLRFIALALGWLFTPLVAGAASFIGAWVGAAVALRIENPMAALWLTVAAAAIFALAATLGWMRLLRRSPELRHALHVTEEGIPEAVAELGSGENP